MRHLLLLLFIAGCAPAKTSPPAPSTSTIRIASMNALRLGHGRKKVAADPSMIALASMLGTYDVVALEEVMTREGAEELALALGRPWNVIVSDDAAGRGTYREFAAFLYRSDRVAFIPRSAIRVPDPRDDFVREPFAASFRAGHFDFTLVAIHLDSPGHAAALSREIRRLDDVFRALQDADPGEDDVILLGDFNRSALGAEFAELRGIETLRPLLDPPPKTSLGESGPANPYDQIWIQLRHTREWTGRSGADDYVKALGSRDYKRYRVEVTDHLPVWAEFRTDQDDDDALPVQARR